MSETHFCVQIGETRGDRSSERATFLCGWLINGDGRACLPPRPSLAGTRCERGNFYQLKIFDATGDLGD